MIECKELYAYYGKKCVLEQISFQLCSGEFVAVVGKNASGKTTLLRSLLGVLSSASGEVLLDGRPLSTYGRSEVARKISYLPQHIAPTSLTVFDTVLLGRLPHLSYPRIYRGIDREIALRAMEKMHLTDCRDTPVNELSGGYRQRVALACALATESDYLFFDEPSTFLDMESTLDFLSILRSLASEGRGIFAVLHDLPLALRFADRLLVIKEGHLVAMDTPEVLYSSGVLEEVFGVRLGCVQADEGTVYYVK